MRKGCLFLSMCVCGVLLAAAPRSSGQVNDPNIRFFGRWDFSNSSQYLCYWGGGYLKVKFTGTTAKIKLGNTSTYYAKIDDGPWKTYLNASGTLNLTPTPLANGTHTLSVAQGKDYAYVFNFQGLIFDVGATTSPPETSGKLIEFVGDSITAGYTDSQANVSAYGWICAEALNCEHTQIAYPGIKLASGYPKQGMDTAYYNLQPINYSNSPLWNFTKYTPNIVVVNLGQNDGVTNVPNAVFQSKYTNLLYGIRQKFPNTEIFALRPFSGIKATQTLAAVNARIAAGDAKVRYVDTTGWITVGTSDMNDGVHPSDSGHVKIANRLKPILEPFISGVTLPGVSFAAPVSLTVTPGTNLYVKVDATDPDGISRVYLYKNGVALARSEGAAPYEWSAPGQNDPELQNLQAGSFTLTAKAVDKVGNFSEKTITITVGTPPALPTVGSIITLKAVNGKYVSATYSTNNTLIANKTTVSNYERFKVVNATNCIALQCMGNNKFVSINVPNGSKPMVADRTGIGSYEKFKFVQSGTQVAMQAVLSTNYVSAISNGVAPLQASQTYVGSYEKFTWKVE